MINYPQMFQLGNLGFSMTHSLDSGNTLAFLHGWSVIRNENCVTEREMISHGQRMHSLLEPSISLWRHPLLLPTLLFQEHLFRCEEFIWRDLSPQIRVIEQVLGITRSGRLAGTEHAVSEEIRKLLTDDERRIQITSAVNTNLTDTINFVSILGWDKRLGDFIRKADGELHQYYEAAGIDRGTVKELEAAVDLFSSEAASTLEHATGMRSRLEMQLNVVRPLYTLPQPGGTMTNAYRSSTISWPKQETTSTLASPPRRVSTVSP